MEDDPDHGHMVEIERALIDSMSTDVSTPKDLYSHESEAIMESHTYACRVLSMSMHACVDDDDGCASNAISQLPELNDMSDTYACVFNSNHSPRPTVENDGVIHTNVSRHPAFSARMHVVAMRERGTAKPYQLWRSVEIDLG